MSEPIALPDMATLRAAYATGATPADTVRRVYARIKAVDDPGIFITLVPELEAVAAAIRLPAFDPDRYPLWGIPFAVKDNIDASGLPTTAACPAFAYNPAETAPAVRRLLDAGAVLVGKTNLDQFATGLVGVRTPHPVPRNALDPALVPGGSSSGSAVAVARGIVSFALGTDTAGSGRVPAAMNGIVGLKPSLGVVSTRGVVPACRTLDCVSVFAPTVAEAWDAFSVMAGYDEDDPYSRELPVARPGSPARFTAAVPNTAAGRAAAGFGTLRDLATTVAEIDLDPFLAAASLLYDGPWLAERYAALREFVEAKPDAIHPVTRKIIQGARAFSAADAFAGQYRLAELKRATSSLWQTFDVLVVPSVPGPCTLAEVEADPIGANARLGTYTNFVNLLDLCALTLPDRGRPGGGVTLIAPAGRDGFLAALGQALLAEDGADPATPAAAPPGWVEVAVLGAHLSGLPLNHHLTGMGAVLLRTVRTTPDYRLFALPGDPPRRPGLVRVGPGAGGAAIATEVWALPLKSFGRFVAAIPPPLGMGNVRLEDGTVVKGFVCETIGTEGAADITATGGWRAYLAGGAAR